MADLRTKKGTLLNKARLEELSDEAQRGYDLSKGVRERGIGRPALGGGKGISPRIAFRAQIEVYEAAQARALAEGRSVSDLARLAMEQYLTTPPRSRTTARRRSATPPKLHSKEAK
ncbi:MAG: hypothetical protein ACYDGR_05370 [Candidatus Dormibacteria bacterium]